MYLIEQINPKIADYIRKRHQEGSDTFALCGGRRSGKTFAIVQFLLGRGTKGEIINVASMTAEQGRLGAYADACSIVKDSPTLSAYYELLSSPREIRSKQGSGKLVFNSYQNPETAKGIACDWLFVNEANNFSKQQYIDLLANVRKGVFIDYNPNKRFWVQDFFKENEILVTTWKDNPFLTPLQKKYFEELKIQAESPNATPVDIRNYNVYYKGEFSELRGKIFFKENFQFLEDAPQGLKGFTIFCDPSALRGADYFACVLSARDEAGNVYIIDSYSTNTGTREEIVRLLKTWLVRYDSMKLYIEVNGLVGIDFYEFARNSGLPVTPWNSRGNKFERIVANYQDFKKRLFFCDHAFLNSFLEQVFEFEEKCEHDDNADALNSSFLCHKYGLT